MLYLVTFFCVFVVAIVAGMSISPTPNPLKHVLNAIGEDVEWLTYGTARRDTVRFGLVRSSDRYDRVHSILRNSRDSQMQPQKLNHFFVLPSSELDRLL